MADMRHASLFNDVHSLVDNITKDLAHFRQVAQQQDDERGQEIEALRKQMNAERYEHREQLNKFQYEFEDLVNAKMSSIVEMIETIHKIEKKDDTRQQVHIDACRDEVQKLKDSFRSITEKWRRFTTRTNTLRKTHARTTRVNIYTDHKQKNQNESSPPGSPGSPIHSTRNLRQDETTRPRASIDPGSSPRASFA